MTGPGKYAFSVNEIFKDMLGYHMRPEKIENLVEAFEGQHGYKKGAFTITDCITDLTHHIFNTPGQSLNRLAGV